METPNKGSNSNNDTSNNGKPNAPKVDKASLLQSQEDKQKAVKTNEIIKK